MNKFIAIALLAIGVATADAAIAQTTQTMQTTDPATGPKAQKKDMKQEKKERKMVKKEYNGSERKAMKKKQKAIKKDDKQELKEDQMK